MQHSREEVYEILQMMIVGAARRILRRYRFKYSFICQGTSTRRQRWELFGLRIKLPPVTTS